MNYFPFTGMLIIIAFTVLIIWPPKQPYVTRKGTDVHETIWLWRAPAYIDHPAWYVRWSWRDGLKARAYCYNPEENARYRFGVKDETVRRRSLPG